ncbi:DUF4097 family beta strand repeat-containing protein [Glycomyces harbinensis]|uniref:Putative adhesin n=1 Tax=Glycomyces harbinensis TaxID=58114 RepID=A0A1G6Y7Q8_9ACTN|nr:DUF4097 family beta strand repeat-containing protein [Glycomyces harbinensis]SDD86400.1 Putative adhesin [Glycomyces harbinensis]
MIDTPVKQSDTAQPDEPAYSGRKVWWIVGGTLTAAVLLFVMAVAGVWIWSASSPREEYTLTEEYPGPVASASVDVEVGDIVIEDAPGTMLELRTHVEWRGAEPDATEAMHGGHFSADAGCDSGLALWGGADDCRVDYTLGLPAGTAATVSNDVGDIRINGVDGAVNAETSVGSVEGLGLRTSELEIETGVGDVNLEFEQVLGDITITSGTGDVVIEVPDDGTTYAVRFDSGVGDQHIDIATDPGTTADRVINVNSGVGSLTVRYAA